LVNSAYEKFKGIANFICVYIYEAHPIDEWNLYKGICYKQPKTLEDRTNMCQTYKNEHNVSFPCVADLMDNNTNSSYSAWPERLYIIQSGKIVFKGGKAPDHYHPEHINQWLAAYSTAAN